jgi:hypothetical protein
MRYPDWMPAALLVVIVVPVLLWMATEVWAR